MTARALPLFTIRRVVTVVALTSVWCALWRQVSVANVLAGAAIAMAVMLTGIGTSGTGGIRPWKLTQLIWLVLIDLVTSTIGVAKEILTPTDNTNEAIVAIDIPAEARQHFLLLVVAVTLTPGTAVVDADPDTGTLYLHLLHNDQSDDVREHVRRLTDLVCQALPTRTANPATASGLRNS